MLNKIFQTHIIVKDFDFSDEWNKRVLAIAKHHFTRAMLEKDGDYDEAGNDSVNLFNKENLIEFPELVDLKNIFIENFYELSKSYEKNILSKEQIEKMLDVQEIGRLPFMRKGDYKRVHSHAGIMAFGIFYLTDVDNKKEGGQLIFHDPSFNNLGHFHSSKEFSVDTKKHRMVLSPGNVWHEVTPYVGEEERFAIVVNLNNNVFN
jgi:hypothetical protein